MSVEDNKATYRLAIEKLNAGDVDALAATLTDDYHWHGPGGAETRGVGAWREMMDAYLTALPDMQMSLGDLIGEDDKIAARWTVTGTHQGELGGIPASGKRITMTGNLIVRFENGKLAEEWENFDEMLMLQQIGAIPAPA